MRAGIWEKGTNFQIHLSSCRWRRVNRSVNICQDGNQTTRWFKCWPLFFPCFSCHFGTMGLMASSRNHIWLLKKSHSTCNQKNPVSKSKELLSQKENHNFITHTIHVWYIHLHLVEFYGLNVGIYTNISVPRMPLWVIIDTSSLFWTPFRFPEKTSSIAKEELPEVWHCHPLSLDVLPEPLRCQAASKTFSRRRMAKVDPWGHGPGLVAPAANWCTTDTTWWMLGIRK